MTVNGAIQLIKDKHKPKPANALSQEKILAGHTELHAKADSVTLDGAPDALTEFLNEMQNKRAQCCWGEALACEIVQEDGTALTIGSIQDLLKHPVGDFSCMAKELVLANSKAHKKDACDPDTSAKQDLCVVQDAIQLFVIRASCQEQQGQWNSDFFVMDHWICA